MTTETYHHIPFLKWAGGKRWLISRKLEIFPRDFNTYIEPFLGSGAVFFHLNPENAILSDSNLNLIESYKSIQSDWNLVWQKLKAHHRSHCKDYYYQIRESHPTSLTGKAAKFIYLNRTCFNGIYRVNLKGKFNVPIGTKKNVTLPTDNFSAVSKLLKDKEIICSDFEDVIDRAKSGDLVFSDPPYTVKHKHNGFIKYNEKLFNWEDQVRLTHALERAVARGVKVVATNADHTSIEDLYKTKFKIERLLRENVIAASSQKRGQYPELIMTANIQ